MGARRLVGHNTVTRVYYDLDSGERDRVHVAATPQLCIAQHDRASTISLAVLGISRQKKKLGE